MVLTTPFQNLLVHQSILLTGLQQAILYLQWPILLYHDGQDDVDFIVQHLSGTHSMFVTTVASTPYRADLVTPQSTVFLAKNHGIVNVSLRKWNLWNAHGKILVILDDPKNAKEWITQLWETNRAVNVVVMVLNETASFFTWFPYKKTECLDVKTISKLKPSNLFPSKIDPPLQGCPLKGTTSFLPPMVIDNEHGMETKLFHVLAQKVGLKAEFVNLPEGQYVWTLFDSAGEPMNGMKLLSENEIDLLFSSLGPNEIFSDFSDFLPPHFKELSKWFVPAPKFASKTSSIYRAFSLEMWIIVFISFICILAILLTVGVFNDSPVLQIFLNTLAINLSIPSKYFKSQRFLVFIAFAYLYSLHITTAYQSSLMVFLSDVPHEKPIKTVEDLQKANLEIMIHPAQAPVVQELAESPTYKEILRADKITYHSYLYLERIVETGTRAIMGPCNSFGFSLKSNLSYFYDLNGLPKILIMEQSVLSSDVSFLMAKGHPLVPLFSIYILRLLAAGIPDQFIDEQMKPPPRYHREIEPFGMDEIEGPFFLYLLLMILSLLAWIAELMFYNFQQKCLNSSRKNPRRPTTTFSRLGVLLGRK